MDVFNNKERITNMPSKELEPLIKEADKIHLKNFGRKVWFGRCIFLSWYCEKGTCTFCFRSVQKHKIKHPQKARRSIASILAEAMMIKGFGWRIEFLTGGYGIRDDQELVRIIKLVSQILDEPIWINLGEIGIDMLKEFKPYTRGIISSIETLDPQLHKQVCPDKPIQPYIDMIRNSQEMGLAQGITIIIGLGEKREDFTLLKQFISENRIDRITIYPLRPVKETPFTQGPDSTELAWWIAQTRIAFPHIEIIVGSAQYRIEEIDMILRSGANAITKLPATNIFNTKKGKRVEEKVIEAGREFTSIFSSQQVHKEADWDGMLKRTDLAPEEKEEVKKALYRYLDKMDGKLLQENMNT